MTRSGPARLRSGLPLRRLDQPHPLRWVRIGYFPRKHQIPSTGIGALYADSRSLRSQRCRWVRCFLRCPDASVCHVQRCSLQQQTPPAPPRFPHSRSTRCLRYFHSSKRCCRSSKHPEGTAHGLYPGPPLRPPRRLQRHSKCRARCRSAAVRTFLQGEARAVSRRSGRSTIGLPPGEVRPAWFLPSRAFRVPWSTTRCVRCAPSPCRSAPWR